MQAPPVMDLSFRPPSAKRPEREAKRSPLRLILLGGANQFRGERRGRDRRLLEKVATLHSDASDVM